MIIRQVWGREKKGDELSRMVRGRRRLRKIPSGPGFEVP